MSFDFINYRETKNLYPHSFEDKETYYHDLGNIEFGMTGRIDAMFANKFFYEAVQLIQNSIVLFEKGFFVRPILAPTVPAGKERIRICIHSFNSIEEIDNLLAEIASFNY